MINNILGQSPGRTMMPGDFAAGPRGPLKERALASLPTAKVLDFVERDIQKIDTHYVRTMATDIALTKKFGSVDMIDQIQKITDEANAKANAAKSEKASSRIHKVAERDIRDLVAMRDRIRGTYQLPDNPDGLLHRSVHTGKTLNYMASLGMMTVSAISDLAKPVMVHGLTRTMATAVTPLTRGLKAIKLAKKDVKLAGQGLDMITNDRVATFADVADQYGHGTVVERGIDRGARLFSFATLMAPWNTVVKQFSGIITQTRLLQACEDWVEGKISGKDKAFLASNGIDANMAGRINDQFAGGKSTPSPALGAIREQVASDLKAIGRSDQEATAVGQLIAERYQARASRLEGTSANELFDAEGPVFRKGDAAASDGHTLDQAPVARRNIDTPEFKSWFAKSKVVDEKGEPLVVYHGTTARGGFDIFHVDNDMGAHFGSADQAFDKSGTLGHIFPVYLSIKNPLRVRDSGRFNVFEMADDLFHRGIVGQKEFDRIRAIAEKRPSRAADVELKRLLQSKGYDGLVYLNRNESAGKSVSGVSPGERSRLSDEAFRKEYPGAHDSYAVFEPTQIKSVGNRGGSTRTTRASFIRQIESQSPRSLARRLLPAALMWKPFAPLLATGTRPISGGPQCAARR